MVVDAIAWHVDYGAVGKPGGDGRQVGGRQVAIGETERPERADADGGANAYIGIKHKFGRADHVAGGP